MKRQTVIWFIFCASFFTVDAQDSYIRNRWNVKVGYASYPGVFISGSGFKQEYGNYRIEADYGLVNYLETALYLGYSRTTSIESAVVGQNLVYKNMNTPFFGAGFNFHPLGFLIRKPGFRFDLFFLGRYGWFFLGSPENYYPTRGLYFQYHHGAGLAFYLTKHVGIFGEYSYGVLAKPAGSLRCGMSVKF